MLWKNRAFLLCVSVFLMVQFSCISASPFFKPFNVSYDHRAMIIDGNRRMLISAGIHYPRATPEVPFIPFDCLNLCFLLALFWFTWFGMAALTLDFILHLSVNWRLVWSLKMNWLTLYLFELVWKTEGQNA